MEESFSNTPDPMETLSKPYSGTELLLAVWTRPREVIRYLLTYEPEKYVTVLLLLSGVVQTFDRAIDKHAGDSFGLLGTIILAVTLGPIGGLLSAYLGSYLLSLSGSWLGGKADSAAIRTVMAWASVPSVGILLILLLEMILFGNDLFSADQPSLEAAPVLVGILAFSKLVLAVWTIRLFLLGLSELQHFSVWKAFVNCLLAGAVIIVPILLLVLLLLGGKGLLG